MIDSRIIIPIIPLVFILLVFALDYKKRDSIQKKYDNYAEQLTDFRYQGDYLEEYFKKIAYEELGPALKAKGLSKDEVEVEIDAFIATRGRYKEVARFRKGESPAYVLKKADWLRVVKMIENGEITNISDLEKICGNPIRIRFRGKRISEWGGDDKMVWEYFYLIKINGAESCLLVFVDERWNLLPVCGHDIPSAQPMQPTAIWK